ncbi:hypothetical protein LCGC14_3155900 [marine sediment metagenome]|uniref:Uncharacterized protein n=1 Tax=marine sediment metagenome TaxID=412755 RepID=A0A0F8WGU9_9ZZZZ|nr:hypothetical protein [Actinomycetota bacterium]
MSEISDYKGYVIDEGQKPHDGNFRPDDYQHFFLVKKGDERVMKLCVWAPKDQLAEIDEVKKFVETGSDAAEYVRAVGIAEVKKRIDDSNFDNILIQIDQKGLRVLPLDKLREKLT